jgi:hypothetical protein
MQQLSLIFSAIPPTGLSMLTVLSSFLSGWGRGGAIIFLETSTWSRIALLVSMFKPLFVLAALFLTVIMPPIPRYMFVGYCRESGHSTNVGSDGFSSRILDACLHFCKVLKTSLVGSSKLGRFWVHNTLACVGSEPGTMQEKLNALCPSLGGDGVHLTDQGRFHLFNNLAETVLGLRNGSLGKPLIIADVAASSELSGRRF